jgi:hypothetical protein
VREDGRIVGAEERQEKVHNREEYEEAPENDKESSHSAHANGMDEMNIYLNKSSLQGWHYGFQLGLPFILLSSLGSKA